MTCHSLSDVPESSEKRRRALVKVECQTCMVCTHSENIMGEIQQIMCRASSRRQKKVKHTVI